MNFRSYLKRTKGHEGYWSCDRCIQKGEQVVHNGTQRLLLCNVNAPLRKDECFLSYHVNDISADEHIPNPEDESPFVELKLPMVTVFVIDSMHTAYGAFGRRLEGLAKIPGEEKLRAGQLRIVEMRLRYFRQCRLYEFDRFVGPFEKCGSYKIHELRHFLYYLLFPVFTGILDDSILEHIMLLQFSMMLLGSFDSSPVDEASIVEAESCLKRYSVELSERNIPCRFVSHQIIHIPQDVRNFKCGVETLSAFQFESFQQFFSRCLRNGNLPTEQIRNRLLEKSKYQLPTTSSGLIIANKLQLALE